MEARRKGPVTEEEEEKGGGEIEKESRGCKYGGIKSIEGNVEGE